MPPKIYILAYSNIHIHREKNITFPFAFILRLCYSLVLFLLGRYHNACETGRLSRGSCLSLMCAFAPIRCLCLALFPLGVASLSASGSSTWLKVLTVKITKKTTEVINRAYIKNFNNTTPTLNFSKEGFHLRRNFKQTNET